MYRRRPRKLPPIISAQGLSKRYGLAPLFQNISFTVSEGDRIGVIGPNGSGKSTLLEMLIGRVKPDSGDVATRKGMRLSTVAQISEFPVDATIRTVIENAVERGAVPETERASRFAETLGRAGFVDLDAHATTLSGGWRKRLAIGELAEMHARSSTASADIDFSATNRKTKQLITLDEVSYGVGNRALFKNVHFSVTSGMRVGLVGPNGSGKTTLLRLMRGDIKPETGNVRRAEGLRVVYFDQNRELDPDITLRRALAPDSDAVIYQDRVIHVASWAERFLFSSENLNQR